MKVLVVTTQVPFIFGGAEIHARNLDAALKRAGHESEIVALPFRWYPSERILDHLLAARLFDLEEANGMKVDRVIGLKFPAYHVRHPHKTLWILHQHRPAFDLWGGPLCDMSRFPDGAETRDAIEHLERKLLREARALFANSGNVAQRLEKFCGHPSTPLYHPPEGADKFTTAEAEDYLFYPSRLCPPKRQTLVIEALAHTREPVHIRFAGKPDNPEYLASLQALARKHGVAKRIEFLGMVSEEQKRDLYARCRGVVFPPIDEDYGYITLEAMLASKAVVTCEDSGGPLEFVLPGQTGLIAEATPETLAAKLDQLWADTTFAREAGQAGRQRIDDLGISWPKVVETLLA